MMCACGGEITISTKRDKASGRYFGTAVCSVCRREVSAHAETCAEVVATLEEKIRREDICTRSQERLDMP